MRRHPHAGSGQVTRSGDRCDTALSPASTFKIPHALVALETGVVTAGTVEKWDGTRHPDQPSWDRDHTVLSAMRPSVLWFFQRIAPRIGAERMHEWLQKLDYGNADTSGPIREYWVNGRLRISPDAQLQFLQRFYAGELPISARHVAAVRGALEQQPGTQQNARGVHTLEVPWPAGMSLNAKTGASTIANGESVSWLVGRRLRTRVTYLRARFSAIAAASTRSMARARRCACSRSGRSCNSLLDGGDERGVGREAARAPFGHLLLTDPHRQLASAADFQRGVEPGFFLDERRHTGGARQVVSDFAVANANRLHVCSISAAFAELKFRATWIARYAARHG